MALSGFFFASFGLFFFSKLFSLFSVKIRRLNRSISPRWVCPYRTAFWMHLIVFHCPTAWQPIYWISIYSLSLSFSRFASFDFRLFWSAMREFALVLRGGKTAGKKGHIRYCACSIQSTGNDAFTHPSTYSPRSGGIESNPPPTKIACTPNWKSVFFFCGLRLASWCTCTC